MTLRELRLKRNLTQQEVANIAGVKRNTIAEIERGSIQPSFEVADRIAAFFGVPIEEIFPRYRRRSPYPKDTAKVG